MAKGFQPSPVPNESSKSKDLRKFVLGKKDDAGPVILKNMNGNDPLKAGRTRGETIFNNPEDSELKSPKKDSIFVSALKEQDRDVVLGDLEDIAKSIQQGTSTLKGDPLLNTEPPQDTKFIDIDELIDSPDDKPSHMASISSQFQFRTMRSDGNQLIIKNSVTGADAKFLFDQIVDT